MNQGPAKSFRCRKGPSRRHLDVIRRWRIERAVSTVPDGRAAVGENDLGGLRRTPRRFFDRRWDVIRNSVDLAGMKQSEGAQQRNSPHRVFLVTWFRVVADLKPPEEKPGRTVLAL